MFGSYLGSGVMVQYTISVQLGEKKSTMLRFFSFILINKSRPLYSDAFLIRQ